MKKIKRASGQITFRCPIETHEELLEIAGHLGIDLTALLNLMVNETRHAFLTRAKHVVEEQAVARAELDSATIHADHPLVLQLAKVGRRASADQRLSLMIDYGLHHRAPDDAPLESLLREALGVLARDEELQTIRDAMDQRVVHHLGQLGTEEEEAAPHGGKEAQKTKMPRTRKKRKED